MNRAHVFISGKVQGVYFRATTREQAIEAGVDGWVRNVEDGRVEAVFEGESAELDSMIDFCHEGPERARVDGINVTWEEPEGIDGFEIRR